MRSLAGSFRLMSSSTKSISVMTTSTASTAITSIASTPWTSSQPSTRNSSA